MKTFEKPLAIFLMGNFFGLEKVDSQEKHQKVLQKVKRLRDLLEKYQSFFQEVKLNLIPDITDLGMNSFPRKPLPRFLFQSLCQQFPNLLLQQNPCSFSFMNKTFYVQRANVIDKGVKRSVVKPSSELESFELMSNTIVAQRNFLPFSSSNYSLLREVVSPSIFEEVANFNILGDDFSPQNMV